MDIAACAGSPRCERVVEQLAKMFSSQLQGAILVVVPLVNESDEKPLIISNGIFDSYKASGIIKQLLEISESVDFDPKCFMNQEIGRMIKFLLSEIRKHFESYGIHFKVIVIFPDAVPWRPEVWLDDSKVRYEDSDAFIEIIKLTIADIQRNQFK